MPTFVIDCPNCKAKVAAEQNGIAENSYWDEDAGEPFAERLYVGKCPRCNTLVAGTSLQTAFENIDSEHDKWSDVVRVYPRPTKTFTSYRIPKIVTSSLVEGDATIQAGANTAACLMFGRALEGVCRDVLTKGETEKTKPIMLAAGIKKLKEKNIIDQRLFDWSQQLHAFRNIAAHPDETTTISREDAEDLQAFVYAIIEYIYDLTDRYDEFSARIARREKRKRPPNA